jgi:hypothetical protein
LNEDKRSSTYVHVQAGKGMVVFDFAVFHYNGSNPEISEISMLRFLNFRRVGPACLLCLLCS